MPLSTQDVRALALLARLDVHGEELAHVTPQLDAIVAFVDQLSELDTENVEPMARAIESVNNWAADETAASLTRDQALENAPARDEECFLVPPVLGPTS